MPPVKKLKTQKVPIISETVHQTIKIKAKSQLKKDIKQNFSTQTPSKKRKGLSVEAQKVAKEKKNFKFNKVSQYVKEYNFIWSFKPKNFQTLAWKEFEDHCFWRDSRIMIGNVSVLNTALKNIKKNTPDWDHFVTTVHGLTGLLFTNKPIESVKEFFDTYNILIYGHNKDIATQDVQVLIGPLMQIYRLVPIKLCENCRALGLDVEQKTNRKKEEYLDVKKAKVICKKDDILTQSQADLLKILKIKTSLFSIKLTMYYKTKTE